MGTTREFLVGLVFFGLLLLLGVFTIMLTDVRLGPEPPSIIIHFANVEGLERGDEVWINGFLSGRVADVHPDRSTDLNKVLVHFNREPVLYGDATFRVKPASPLGGRILDIERGHPLKNRTDPVALRLPEMLNLDGYHEGTSTADVLTEAAQLIRENRESIHGFLENMDSLTRDLSVRAPDALDAVNSTLASVRSVSEKLARGEGALGRLLVDPEIDRLVTDLVAAIRDLAVDIRQGKGVLGALVYDPELRADAVESVRRMRALADELSTGKGTLGRLVRDPELYDIVVGVARNVRSVTQGLSAERGLGRLLAADATWERLDTALTRLDETVAHIREATMTPDNVVGYLLSDEEPVVLLRRSLRNVNEFLESTRENAPIATFAGFLFQAF